MTIKKQIYLILSIVLGLTALYGFQPETPEGFQGFGKIIGFAELIVSITLLVLAMCFANAYQKNKS